MYNITNTISQAEVKGLKASKILDVDAKEILSISLEKGTLFPKHSSPREAHLIVLEGEIVFYINETSYTLKKFQILHFPEDEEHWVEANENSKFIIIR